VGDINLADAIAVGLDDGLVRADAWETKHGRVF
jgi:hypothetical protein